MPNRFQVAGESVKPPPSSEPESFEGRFSKRPDQRSPSRRRNSREGRRRWIWLLPFIALGATVIDLLRPGVAPRRMLPGTAAPASSEGKRAVPVAAATARRGDIGIYIQALGTVTPLHTVAIMSRVQGEIMRVYYREGQTVSRGDPLLEIDPRPYEAAVLQAEGQLARDQAALRAARVDLARYRKAYARRAIPEQQLYDQQQLMFQDQGAVKADQGVLASARVNLAYCHIAAPIDGRVGLRLVDPGNIVQGNGATSLVVITQLQPISVIFSVAEDYLAEIQREVKRGGRMEVDALDRTQRKKLATGTFLTLDNLIDTTTGTVRIRAVFDNQDNSLFPNQFVNARLRVSTRNDATLVAADAIQRGAQGSFVYVIRPDQTIEVRVVKVDSTEGEIASVEGIRPGELVAVSGFDKLQQGAKVVIRERRQMAFSTQEARQQAGHEAGIEPGPEAGPAAGSEAGPEGGPGSGRPTERDGERERHREPPR